MSITYHRGAEFTATYPAQRIVDMKAFFFSYVYLPCSTEGPETHVRPSRIGNRIYWTLVHFVTTLYKSKGRPYQYFLWEIQRKFVLKI
jgi:hypothetical protein